ncbi:MAG TPA: phosphatase PAP2-related protein [Candidatus Acidoferrum sp.]|nr:phosphatase PAP2-related protein [Candidatus Acidoferrum sp.]
MRSSAQSGRGSGESPQIASGEGKWNWRRLLRRIVLTAIALGIWFWTQSLIAQRAAPVSGVGDALHTWTAGLNSYFYHSPAAANALLILSSALIDGLGVFLLVRWLFGPSVRPFLGLFLLLGLRQILQAICALPVPPNMIWHYPGFPSLLVTYNVGNDFFFSGHTAIAVFGGIELARLGKRWLTIVAAGIVVFEILTVLVLRAHYTMDVFTGLLAAIVVAQFCAGISPRVDAWLAPAK